MRSPLQWLVDQVVDQILPALKAHAAHTDDRITALEDQMSLTDAALAELDEATNDVAADLDQLRAQVATFDADIAQRIGEQAARLRQLAADPNDPVPAEPAPVEPSADTDLPQ